MILFILLALTFLRVLLFKPRTDVLCCGIWGGSFRVPLQDEMLLKKLAILGMMNQDRGEDSVGYFNGNDLIKDADKNKKVVDFVMAQIAENNGLSFKPNDGTNNVFIGHNRKASRGMANLENAHPFNIEDKIIFAHNGTLDNHFTLGTKHGVDHSGIFNDSRVFGALLVKIGPKILEEYKGYAAIALHKLDEPGSLYLFHGASKEFSTDKQLKEERPLFYMKAKEGVFFSSTLRPLEFIRTAGDEEPVTLPHNIVFHVKNGVFLKNKIKIYRDEMNVSVYSGYTGYNYNRSAFYHHDRFNQAIINRAANAGGSSASRSTNVTNNTNATVGKNVSLNRNGEFCKEGFDITKEFHPKVWMGVQNKGRIMYWQNRHWIIGAIQNGICPSDALCHGPVLIDHLGKYHATLGTNNDDKIKTYYFWKGIMLVSKAAFETINDAVQNHDMNDFGRRLTRPALNFAKAISKYAKYPVTNMKNEAEHCNIDRDLFFLDEKYAEGNNGGNITPLFSQRIYRYKNGKLIWVRSLDGDEMTFFP
jgi:hypothetical protein